MLSANMIESGTPFVASGSLQAASSQQLVRVSLNENPYGPSSNVPMAIQREFGRLNRYGDDALAEHLAAQVAAYEDIPKDQILLGEILSLLGEYLGSQGNGGGEFIYSTPGYLALIAGAARVGGNGVPVPLNARHQNDLPALTAKVNERTRAIYVVNPHNPTGTVNESQEFKRFVLENSKHTVVIVDEAYLEYTADFTTQSTVSLVRDGANVIVFRTFDKIHGLAGLPIGYILAPRNLTAALREQGAGNAESLGRLNLVAASAALKDTAQVERTKNAVAQERSKWHSVLRDLKLEHTDSTANFVFFNACMPQPTLAAAMLSRGADIGRAHPPYMNWARITIGLPEENQRVQALLSDVLRAVGPSTTPTSR